MTSVRTLLQCYILFGFNSLTCILSISDLRTVIVKFYIFFAINILVSHKTSIKTHVWEFQIIQGIFVSLAMAKCDEDLANCLQNLLKHRRNSLFADLNLKR
jgi:hypothetical protein